MPKKLTDEEYAKSLPMKTIGAGVLFFNAKGEMLIVKPDYKEGWLLPGGTVELDESPHTGALREVKEEIGLEVESLELVGVSYRGRKGLFGDAIMFVFSGGTLSDDQISQIVLQTDELEEYIFLAPEEATSMLSKGVQNFIPQSLAAMKEGKVAYVESL